MSRSLEKIETPIPEEIHSFKPPNLKLLTEIELDEIPSVERVLANDRFRVQWIARIRLFITLETRPDDK